MSICYLANGDYLLNNNPNSNCCFIHNQNCFTIEKFTVDTPSLNFLTKSVVSKYDIIPAMKNGYTARAIFNHELWYYLVITKDDNTMQPIYVPRRYTKEQNITGDLVKILDRYFEFYIPIINLTIPKKLTNEEALELLTFIPNSISIQQIDAITKENINYMINKLGTGVGPSQYFKFYNFFILTLSRSLDKLRYIFSLQRLNYLGDEIGIITNVDIFNVLVYTKINDPDLILCKKNIIKELSKPQKDIINNPKFIGKTMEATAVNELRKLMASIT